MGVRRTARDGRVADVAALRQDPVDPDVTWHSVEVFTLVVEVWPRSSEEKDRFPHWYASVGIPEYWLAEPVEHDKWDALITMYELARTPSGTAAYVEVRKTSLAELTRNGLG